MSYQRSRSDSVFCSASAGLLSSSALRRTTPLPYFHLILLGMFFYTLHFTLFQAILIHRFSRPGDLARIEENAGAGLAKKASKLKKPDATSAANSKSAEGVVYKVTSSICYIVYRSQSPHALAR